MHHCLSPSMGFVGMSNNWPGDVPWFELTDAYQALGQKISLGSILYMVSWQLLSDNTSAEVWDKRLMQFPDYNIYQVYAWGQHRANFGWKPLRLMALDQEGNLAAMIQVMLRRYPGNIVLLWSPGGPVGNLEACNDSLPQALIRETRSKRIYCRISSLRAYQTCDALTLKACSWTKCSQPLNSGLSMSLQLHTEEQFLTV